MTITVANFGFEKAIEEAKLEEMAPPLDTRVMPSMTQFQDEYILETGGLRLGQSSTSVFVYDVR